MRFNVLVEACEQLGLLQINFAMCDDNIILKFPDLFEDLGCLPGFYKIAVDHLVPPFKHASRKVPASIKTKIKEGLDKLVNLQVIIPVKELTYWISEISMICVKKPNKLHICLDLKHLNIAIKRPNYPIFNIDNILVKLSKAKLFSVVDCEEWFWQVVFWFWFWQLTEI